MTQNQLLITIIIISSCFFIGCLIFNQGKMVLTLLGRGILGTLVIGIANTILLNFTVAALLGIPGIAALYGIGLWQIFH